MEDDRIMNDKRGMVRQSKVRQWITLLCIGVVSSIFMLVSVVAPLISLCTFMLELLGSNLALKSFIVLSISVGGAILSYLVAPPVVTFLAEELGYFFNLHLEASGADQEDVGIDESKSVYAACPLRAADSIRIIHLRPGSPNDELRCTLEAVRLGEQPPYEALSYCWGQRASNRCIKLQTSSSSSSPAPTLGDTGAVTTLTITDTLHDALIYLRYPQKERILWVDQICINQNDYNERSSQVKLMQDIYSSTRCAIIWLRVGRPLLPAKLVNQESKLPGFFEEIRTAMSKLARQDGLEDGLAVRPETYKVRGESALEGMTNFGKYSLPDQFDQRWLLLYGFFDTPWVSRVWIIQEVSWPKKVEVHYTNLETSWQTFVTVMNFVESLNLVHFNANHSAARHFFSRLRALQACRERTQAGISEPLDKVLSQHRIAVATDPRDHVYGLMGLASGGLSLEPDYEASTRHVFLETAKWAIQKGSLDILGLCGDPSSLGRPNDLPRPKFLLCSEGLTSTPSWVPDFSDAAEPHSLTGMDMPLPHKASSLTKFCASGGSAASPRFDTDGVMEVLGHSIGKIQELAVTSAAGKVTQATSRLRARAQIETGRLHFGDVIRESLRMLNTKMTWAQLARKEAEKRIYYELTGERTEDAIMRTCLLDETGDALDRLRVDYETDQVVLKLWELLTLGQGCSSLFLGNIICGFMWLGLWLFEQLFCRYKHKPRLATYNEYFALRHLSAERELFCDVHYRMHNP